MGTGSLRDLPSVSCQHFPANCALFCPSLLLFVIPSHISLQSPNLSHLSPRTDLKSPHSLCSRTVLVKSALQCLLCCLSLSLFLQTLSKVNKVAKTSAFNRTQNCVFCYLLAFSFLGPSILLVPSFSALTAGVHLSVADSTTACNCFFLVPCSCSRASSSAACPPSRLEAILAAEQRSWLSCRLLAGSS